MKKLLILTSLVMAASTAVQANDDNVLPSWAFGGFERPEGVNPLITPRAESVFDCPMRNKPVNWELADTFNPAAVVKDGKICILYRAEDNPNAGIGGRTSRIGLAFIWTRARTNRCSIPTKRKSQRLTNGTADVRTRAWWLPMWTARRCM